MMNVIRYETKPEMNFGKRKILEVWGARSESNKEKIYTVLLDNKGKWSCACPRWTRNASRPECKHIEYIKNFRVNGFKPANAVEKVSEQVSKSLARFVNLEI